ncbi:hypothetical protein [Actinomadura sp. WMMA1423]|uniref:hypothetical protein n=1 Tax=Actinomadura sp. WMMA1423 TaxID=2591108 RepID=UPI001146DCC4|nr:hypothetical protein [Actinomadura sp. WMMA1423]
MSEPSVTSGGTGGEPRTGGPPWTARSRRTRLWVAAFLVLGFAVSYGLALPVLSGRFWLAIPGMLGLAGVGLGALLVLLHWPFAGTVPYATDGTDRRGPTRYYYRILIGRFLLLVVACGAMMVLPRVVSVHHFDLFFAIGPAALAYGTVFWLPQIVCLRKCARVLKVYDFEFRAPVKRVGLPRKGALILDLGTEGSAHMSARDPLFTGRLPKGIERGVWFAGDEPFGGVILVPDTGELMLVRPENWTALDTARRKAGPERRERARRAGLARK